jgi:hypothetical protein
MPVPGQAAPGGVLINLGELHDFGEIFSGTQMARA